jgi:uncharacterized protein
MITWDEKKRKQVIKDHKVDLAEIEDVFEDPHVVEFEDFGHSTDDEVRFNIIGLSAAYGLVFVTYIFANDESVRLITARRAEKWMVSEYEKNRKRL